MILHYFKAKGRLMLRPTLILFALFLFVRNSSAQEANHPATGITTRASEQFAVGDNFQILLQNGIPYTWGFGNSGELGHGMFVENVPAPQSLSISNIIAVAAGSMHGLALAADGEVWVWGNNAKGQLGLGDTKSKNQPTKIEGLEDVIGISATAFESIFLKADGTVWISGQHNNYSTGNKPVPLDFPVPIIDIEGGSDFALALDANGNVWGWGGNIGGGLGDIGSTDTPKKKAEINGAIAISAGYNHCLILKSDGAVWGWGFDGEGQLGGVPGGPSHDVAIQLEQFYIQEGFLLNVKHIAAGYKSSIFVKADGSVFLSGNGGSGPVVSFARLVTLPFNGQFRNILWAETGLNSHFAVSSEGSLYKWDNNGPLTNPYIDYTLIDAPKAISAGTKNSNSLYNSGSPVLLDPPFTNAIQVASGKNHTLYLASNGTVWGKGDNTYGQLGNGMNQPDVQKPVQVISLENVVAIAAGDDHSMALRADGTVWAWGNNQFGNLGDGTFNDSNKPVQSLVDDFNGDSFSLTGVKEISAGNSISLALFASGHVAHWGSTSSSGPQPIGQYMFEGSPNVKHIASGGFNHLALMASGVISSWGDNMYGQLGMFSFSPVPYSDNPVKVFLEEIYVPFAKGISVGGYHCMALISNGRLKSWGRNLEGQLGIGNNYKQSSAEYSFDVSGPINSVRMIGAGGLHSLALKADGTICATGSDSDNQLGDGQMKDQNIFQCGAVFQAPFVANTPEAKIADKALLTVYPNPASNYVQWTASINNDKLAYILNVTDLMGGTIIQDSGTGSEGRINLGRVTSGSVYILVIAFEDGSKYTGRIYVK